ncbi:MAG: glycosyltransferase, partial [Bdellovibrionaceae bacterium]|nr:glycosyltransferase [Pseudobdellovibrionaceae bacterium]
EFENNSSLGILFPSYFDRVSQFVFNIDRSNDEALIDLLRRAGKKASVLPTIDPFFFPAGDMFWFRSKAIAQLVNFNFTPQDFDNEKGQVNGTLAHAIERMFPYFCQQQGLLTRAFIAQSFLSEICSAHEIALIKKYIANGVISKTRIIFDHDIGGGTNKFTRQFVNESILKNEQIIRIYFSESRWFVQWISENDGMLFYTTSLNELYKMISLTPSNEIIINSIYGYPGIAESIDHILKLKETLRATLEIKVHDFYAVCSSPHLADYTRKYCGVPNDHKVCKNCLSKNKDWYHSWYPRSEIPTSIDSWRKPFKLLLQRCDSITFFNESSIEIMKKAFDVDESKIHVVPHNTDYTQDFKPLKVVGDLHIGLIGTLSHIKGGYVVESLYQHIVQEKLNIPITVIGSSVVDTSSGVEVVGNYETKDIPRIIEKKGVNVILMPSIVPETFSYTISEAMALNLPIVCFDLGAQSDRVRKYSLGSVISLNSSPAEIISAAKRVLKKVKTKEKTI